MIDTHCHLDDEKLYLSAGEIISKFDEHSIEKVINAGASLEGCKRSVKLCNKYDKVYATVGIHPEEATDFTSEAKDFIIKSATNPKVVAVGEIGLDYYYEVVDRAVQQKVMAEQIEMAKSLKLPVVLHVRDAFKDALDILKDNTNKLDYGVVLHCYSGSREMLREFDKFDVFYSFGGAITFKNYGKADVIQAVRRDRIMLETDSPYITPVPFRGKVNTPLNVTLVANKMAEMLSVSVDEIEKITTENAKTIYSRIR